MSNDNDKAPDDTPWGKKQMQWSNSPGLIEVDTARHGGLYVMPALRERIPDSLKKYSADGKGAWWEEDQACSLPVVALLSARPIHP
jgi:hypothetical protein